MVRETKFFVNDVLILYPHKNIQHWKAPRKGVRNEKYSENKLDFYSTSRNFNTFEILLQTDRFMSL